MLGLTEAPATRYVSGAEANKLVRARLAKAWPGVKFRVRKTAGGSTDIEWTDGPTVRQVQAVCAEFTGETFDGMTDCRDSVNQLYIDESGRVEKVSYLTGLMLYQRTWSFDTQERLTAWAGNIRGLDEREVRDWAWREFAKSDLCETAVSVAVREP